MTEAKRPLVSLLVATFQQEHIVEQAVRAALAQTYSPLEILISDDASTDATFDRIAHALLGYDGLHRVMVRRNTRNEGISAHFSQLAQLASGELLCVAAGDDVSEPQRCAQLVSHWLACDRRPDLIATDLLDMDAQGTVHRTICHSDLDALTLQTWCAARPWLVGASHAWSKRLFTRFGPLRPGAHAEDQIMLLRALLAGGATTLHMPLVRWRRGGLSSKRSATNLAALRAQMRSGNASTLAALEQHLSDARTAKHEGEVAAALAPALARARYTEAMLGSQSASQRLRCFAKATQVRLGYRLRLLGYTLLPWPYDAAIRFKSCLRLTRGRDAAGRPAQSS